jgi:microcystin-dependent protein
MAEPFLGEIRMFAGNFAPSGWALCNGQTLSVSTNAALFAVIGTYYGGNGTTTFNLPNLQSRVAVHVGQGNGLSAYVIGQSAGVENVILTPGQMPVHNHLINCVPGGGNQSSPLNNLPAIESTGTSLDYSNAAEGGQMNANALTSAGNSQPFSVIQPYVAVTFIIALQGIFPSRN